MTILNSSTLRPTVLALLLTLAMAVPMVSTARGIPAAELLLPAWSGDLVANSEFVPPAAAAAAHGAFQGKLLLTETAMTTAPRVLTSRSVLGRDPALFPGIELAFFTVGADLVPVTQDVIRRGSTDVGHSFWDVIVQPGRVWSEPDDGDWSRAAFPFALVNSIEGETHNGIATFLYKAGRVSNLRFQIVQQTAPFYIKDYFNAAGLVPATYTAANTATDALVQRYQASLADAIPMTDWHILQHMLGGDVLGRFDDTMAPSDIVLSGLDVDGTFYLKECKSAAGPLPWCDRMRFGVWSATKALANEAALLRLAQKYGPAVFDAKIKDYVPGVAGHPGWDSVRFQDAIDMATGIGNGTSVRRPNDINDGYLNDAYRNWYEARSVRDKVTALVEARGVYPWGPGKVARYRDQDMFLLGVAMDHYLKSKEGPSADLWSFLTKEVFEPIGIHEAPVNRTLETDGSPGFPLMAYGYYPTVSDMVHLARLYQNDGKHGTRQILYQPRIHELLSGSRQGRPTGEKLAFGETLYANAFWFAPYRDGTRCRRYYPRMIGWGGNIVALLPNGITGLRLAKSPGTADNIEVETAGMAAAAEQLTHFCR